MAAPQNHTLDAVDIGSYRKIRLKANRQGYYEIWWTERRGVLQGDGTGGSYLTKRESCRTKIEDEARAYLAGFVGNLKHAQTAAKVAQAPTVDALCQRWLNHVALQGKDKTGGYVLVPIRRELGHLTPGQLDAQVLQDYTQQRPVKPGTVRRELGALRTVLIWAGKQKLFSRDDMPSIDESVLPQDGPPRDKFLDTKQEQALWDQAMSWPDQRIKLFIALGLETAARREAILDLTWDRIDLGLKQIDYRVPGKRITKKRRTRVPISDRLMPVLVVAHQEAHKRSNGGTGAGKVVGMTDISRPLAAFVEASKTPWVTPHVLRHTWGSLKAMKGASLYDIAKVMGDKIETIEKYYLHLTPDHLRSVVNL
jgi:integrase